MSRSSSPEPFQADRLSHAATDANPAQRPPSRRRRNRGSDSRGRRGTAKRRSKSGLQDLEPSGGTWLIDEEELEVLSGKENELGRGAFGEVRVGIYRGLRVAVKLLHGMEDAIAAARSSASTCDEGSALPTVLTPSNAALISRSRELMKEMEVLSQLRHPNLLLALGLCVCDTGFGQLPRGIVTELMPCSLYDILHKSRLRLSTTEVLDVGCGVAAALRCMHGQSPPIIHRDISAKNVLVDGHRVCLGDLGQAKIFGRPKGFDASDDDDNSNGNSKLTAVPGALAYAAPEVLTGKYSTMIDIFSTGVLLVQCCTSEYPKIQERERQVQDALQSFPALKGLISSCLHLQPELRPTSAALLDKIADLKKDGFWYATPPGHPSEQAGILQRRWMESEIERHSAQIAAECNSTAQLLAVEQGRWQKEAMKRDEAEERVAELQSEVDALREKLRATETKASEQTRRDQAALSRAQKQITDAERTRVEIQNERDAGADTLRTREVEAETLRREIERWENRAAIMDQTVREAEETKERANKHIQRCTAEAQCLADALKAATDQMDRLKVFNQETEERVVQALHRWEIEKAERLKLSFKMQRLKQEAAVIEEQREKALRDLEKEREKVNDYVNLPAADALSRQLNDLQEQVTELLRENAELVQQRGRWQSEAESKEREIEAKSREVEDIRRDLSESRKEVDELEKLLNSTKESMDATVLERTAAISAEAANAVQEAKLARERADVAEKKQSELQEWLERTTPSAACKTCGKLADSTSVKRSDASLDGEAEGRDDEDRPDGIDSQDARIRESDIVPGLSEAWETDAQLEEVNLLLSEAEEKSGALGILRLLQEASLALCASATDAQTHVPTNESAIVAHTRSTMTLYRGMKLLLTRHCQQKEALGEEGVFDVFPRILSRLWRTEEVQTFVASIKLVSALVFKSNSNRERARRSNVCACLPDAIRKQIAQHRAEPDKDLLMAACTTLTNLSHNSDANRIELCNAGAVDVVLDAMECAPLVAEVQRSACWAMLTLAATESVAREIAAAGGIGAIVAALLNNPSDADVAHFGCWALLNILLDQTNDAILKLAKSDGVGKVLESLLQRFGSRSDIVDKAEGVLRLLETNDGRNKRRKSRLGSEQTSRYGALARKQT